jgi:hypothetical protein
MVAQLKPGQRAGVRAGRDEDVLGLHLALFALAARAFCNGDGVYAVLGRASEAALAAHDGDLVLAHQEIEALDVLRDDAVLPLQHLGPVERGLGQAFNAVLRRMLDVFEDLGVEEQRLGRDAAPVKAGAAQFVLALDERNLEAMLPGANRRRVSGRPPT